jgi:hypothetical protein
MKLNARIAGLIFLSLPLFALAQDVAPPASTQAATPPPAASAEPELPALVRVTGVETLNDYATVSRLLAAAGGVKRVDVMEAEGSTVTFRVMVRGGSAALEQALESASQLARSGSAAVGLTYELRR